MIPRSQAPAWERTCLRSSRFATVATNSALRLHPPRLPACPRLQSRSHSVSAKRFTVAVKGDQIPTLHLLPTVFEAGASQTLAFPSRSLVTVRLRACINRRVEVPFGRKHWPPVAEGNCVVERRGGEQPEANVQSISKTMLNSIRPDTLASLPLKGEAGDWKLPLTGDGNSDDLHCGDSERGHSRGVLGVWRWNGGKLKQRESGIAIRERMEFMTEGGPKSHPEGDRALVVAKKRGNARGAKGGREVEA